MQILKKGNEEGQQLLNKMGALTGQMSARKASMQLSILSDTWKAELQSAETAIGVFSLWHASAHSTRTQLYVPECGSTTKNCSTHNDVFAHNKHQR